MPLETTGLWWAAAVVGAAALIIGGIALWAGFRRRRQHRTLMREAVTRLLAESEVQPIRRLHRDLVMVLIRQDDGAAQLGRMPDAGAVAGVRELFARTDPVALVEGVFGPIGHRLVDLETASLPETADGAQPDLQIVPRVADVDGLVRLCVSMHDTVRAEVRLVRAILAAVPPEASDKTEDNDRTEASDKTEASDRTEDETKDNAEDEDEEKAEGEVRQAFEENLTDVLQAARRGRELALSGQPLDALDALTGVESTLPEDGIPGRGFRPYLREQAFELARAALQHRAAVTDWCATVECREGRV